MRSEERQEREKWRQGDREKLNLFPRKRKPFVKPEIKREEPLQDITLFTSTANVTGVTFF